MTGTLDDLRGALQDEAAAAAYPDTDALVAGARRRVAAARRRRLSVLGAVGAAALVSGGLVLSSLTHDAGQGELQPAGPGPKPAVVTASPSPAPAVANGGSTAASAGAVKSYVQALALGAPAAIRQRLALTAPGSGAYRYLDHEANAFQAGLDAGQPAPANEAAAPDGANAYTMCFQSPGRTTCATYGGFTATWDGRLVDFTVDGLPVAQRVTAGSGQTVSAGGVKLTFLSAYRSVVGGVLQVTVRVQTGAEAVAIDPSQWSYRGPNGASLTAATGWSPAVAVPVHASRVALVDFPATTAGGSVHLGGCSSKDCPRGAFSAVMKIG
jgi:hypothetical protein